MNKILSSTKRRQRDLRYRDIFEKVLPEVKKNREDREMTGLEYTKTGMDDGMFLFKIFLNFIYLFVNFNGYN